MFIFLRNQKLLRDSKNSSTGFGNQKACWTKIHSISCNTIVINYNARIKKSKALRIDLISFEFAFVFSRTCAEEEELSDFNIAISAEQESWRKLSWRIKKFHRLQNFT